MPLLYIYSHFLRDSLAVCFDTFVIIRWQTFVIFRGYLFIHVFGVPLKMSMFSLKKKE